MPDAPIQASLEADYETELSRLGSSKALYAITGGEMETEAVLSGLATRTATAAATFEGWAGEDQHAETFADAGATARDQASRIAAEASDVESADDPTRPDEVLRGLEGDDARLGGLLAWTLLIDRTLAQAVGFFVGNADPQVADLFRDLRSGIEARRVATTEALADADAAVARSAAGSVIEAAYEDYVESLESMGVKVKPVC